VLLRTEALQSDLFGDLTKESFLGARDLFGREEHLTVGDAPNRGDQLVATDVLQDVAARPARNDALSASLSGTRSASGIRDRGAPRATVDRGRRRCRRAGARRAPRRRCREVEHERFVERNRPGPRPRGPFGIEQLAKSPTYDLVIVNEQKANHLN